MYRTMVNESAWLAAGCLLAGSSSWAQPSTYAPVKWEKFIAVEGQPLPVPEQWLDTEEARIAHNLKLPKMVPTIVPFDFKAAGDRSLFTSRREVAGKYFDHLCSTEAGQWVFKTAKDVQGLYFARPQAPLTTEVLTDAYGPEMPWIQRWFLIQGDDLKWGVRWLIEPPRYNYRYVEQPRRNVEWQKKIAEPYVRLFGLTREVFVAPGQVVAALNDRTPMQVVGITKPTARYGYIWRGLRRERDREHNIAGGEILIYERESKEVIAVARQFLLASRNPRGNEKTLWSVAARCHQFSGHLDGIEFTQFAFDVLQTTETSTTGR